MLIVLSDMVMMMMMMMMMMMIHSIFPAPFICNVYI